MTSLKSKVNLHTGSALFEGLINFRTNSKSSDENEEKNLIKNEFIKKIEENLKNVSTDWNLAQNTFYTTIILGMPIDRVGFPKGLPTLENVVRFYNAFNADAAQTDNEARFKQDWYGALERFFFSKTEPKPFRHELINEKPSTKEINDLATCLDSFNPHLSNKRVEYVDKWSIDNKDKISSTLSKNITHELFMRVMNFFQTKDISYFRWANSIASNRIDDIFTQFFCRAVEDNIRYAHDFLNNIIDVVENLKSENFEAIDQEKNQLKHRLFYLCYILLKNNYFEQWLLELTLDLLIRHGFGRYCIDPLSRSFTYISENMVQNLLVKLSMYDKGTNGLDAEYNLPNGNKLKIPKSFFDYDKYGESYKLILCSVTSSLFQRAANRKQFEFAHFVSHQEPIKELSEPDKQTLDEIASKSAPVADELKSFEDFAKDFSKIEILREIHDNEVYRNALTNLSNIAKKILQSKTHLELLIQEAGSPHTKNLFKQFIEFIIWMMSQADESYFADSYERITPDNLEVADSNFYLLLQRDEDNNITFQENLVKHLILGLTGDAAQQTAAQETFAKIPQLGSIYRQKLNDWFKEFKAKAAAGH